MSEPRKEENKPKPILSKNTIIICIVIAVIGSAIYVGLNIFYPEPEIEPTQQNPPNVVQEPEPVKVIETESRFNIKDFDNCVDLLIGFVKLSPYPGEKLDAQTQLELNGLKSEYYDLNCNLVEEQLASTDKYRNRNNE